MIVNPETKALEWKDVPDPVCLEDSIIVDIHCAALNRADLLQRDGKYPSPKGWPSWMGLELSGVIVEMGEKAQKNSSFQIGDKVCALVGGGAYAERIAVPYQLVMHMPKGLSFEEASAIPEALATRLKVANSTKGCTSGFLTSWWFNYGFSVGGSCIGYLTSENGGLTAEEANSYYGGYYTFTLADSTLNYRVKVDGGIDVNGNHYDNNEIVSYEDKFFMNDALADKCDILPSQRQAFTEYLSLSGKKDGADAKSFYNKGDEAGITDEFYEIVPYRLNGGQKAGILRNNELVMNKHGEIDNLGNLLSAQEKAGDLVVIKNKDVSPNPSSFSTDGRVGNFANGQVAMVVEVRACVASFRSMITDFEWDVAPMLVYREYDNNNNTVRRGIEGAHSGSACWSVWSKSTIKNAAYLFVKYVTCGEGQDYLAKAGTIIPNNKEAAKAQVNEDVAAGKSPSNLGIFLDGAEYQTPGDWWFLYDNDWIDGANCWAPKLNNYVRNYKLTLSDFYSSDDYKLTFERLRKYTEK